MGFLYKQLTLMVTKGSFSCCWSEHNKKLVVEKNSHPKQSHFHLQVTTFIN
jgi:hypothetical protein